MNKDIIGKSLTTQKGVLFTVTTRTDPGLLARMENHYSHPKGFVGRNICLSIEHEGIYYGHIVYGSATKHLPGRHEFLCTTKEDLNNIINNIFYNISCEDKYPFRNFTTYCLLESMKFVKDLWEYKYEDAVKGFETLVEPPRTGELYKRAGFTEVGKTKGFTCKRIGGESKESWSGVRVWNKNPDELRPKIVLCKSVYNETHNTHY